MHDYYKLEWKFEPVHFFEQELNLEVDGVTINVRDGTADAKIARAQYDSDVAIPERLHEHLFQAFRGAQLIALKPFHLERPSKIRIHPDGKQDIFLGVASELEFTIELHAIDVIIRRADGTSIDPKADRLAAKRELAERVGRFSSDDHLTAMLNSVSRALTDKSNCLIHLYEILDSLATRFGSQSNAIAKLSLKKTQWSELGRLANDEPLEEGRHRGKKALSLRPVTSEELDRCKQIASNFIVQYLHFLERQP